MFVSDVRSRYNIGISNATPQNPMITISEFRKQHNLSNLKFARLRAKAERLNPGVKMTSYHHDKRHNYNVVLRVDLLEALLPLKCVADKVVLENLYARIARLEAKASKTPEGVV